MTKIVEYSSKATALRGVARMGMTDKARAEEFVSQPVGSSKWIVDQDAVEAALGLSADMTEEDENLVLACGHSHCPHCGIHLSNGLLDFDSLVDTRGSEKEAYKLQKHEWACMGCNGEWGKEIPAPTSKGRKEPLRHYSNKSSVEGAVNVSHEIFNSMPEARRKDAIAAAVEAGVTFYTARTQYQKWFKARNAARTK